MNYRIDTLRAETGTAFVK